MIQLMSGQTSSTNFARHISLFKSDPKPKIRKIIPKYKASFVTEIELRSDVNLSDNDMNIIGLDEELLSLNHKYVERD